MSAHPTPLPCIPGSAAHLASAWADGWLQLDLAGQVVDLNRRFLDVWRFSAEEIAGILGASPQDRCALLMRCTLTRVRDPATVTAAMQRQLAMPEEVTFEDLELTDGRILERYGVPLHDPGGRITGRAISLRDVSSRRRADVELRERARQQEAVADLGKAAVSSIELDALLDLAVRAVARTLGADLAHLLELGEGGNLLALRAGRLTEGALSPERVDEGASTAALAAVRGSTVVVSDLVGDTRFTSSSRGRGYAAAVSAMVGGRAHPFGVLCAHWTAPRAVTEDEVHFVETVANILAGAVARREAELEVLARGREVRAVFEASLDGLLTFGDDGLVTEANPAAGRIFERPSSQLAGLPVFSFFGENELEHCRANFCSLIATGGCAGEQELRLAGRATRTVEYAAVARILPGRHLLVLRDITERRRLQAQLALADWMVSVGTLASGVAHELNNPLSYVAANLTFVEGALRDLVAGASGPAAEVADFLAAVSDARQGATQMRSIIRNLRTFSRGDEGRAGPVDLGPVLESCVQMAWNELRHRARLVRELAELPSVHGNEARLGQVFLNLLVNAAQAISEGAAERNTVALCSHRMDDGRVAVEVKDTGSGIAPENLRRIFDPFFTTKPIGIGTGLGLSICHNIVTSLGGTIEVESTPGHGTTFRVVLLPGEAAAPEPRAEAARAG